MVPEGLQLLRSSHLPPAGAPRAVLLYVPQPQISFVSGEEGAALSGQKGQIELVVGEGVEAFLPMAGAAAGWESRQNKLK